MSGHSNRARSHAYAKNTAFLRPGTGLINIQIAPSRVSNKPGLKTMYGDSPRVLNYFNPKINQAVRNAINRSLDSFRTAIIRETAQKYHVQQKELRAATHIIHVKPTWDLKEGLHGVMVSRGHRKSLAEYKIVPGRGYVKPGTFRGAVMKAGGLKPIPLAFLIPGNGRYKPVIREPDGSLRPLTSPSVPQLMSNRISVNKAFAVAEEVFEKRLDHEVMRLLGALP